MKKIAILFTTLCLLQGTHAQTITSAVPGYISYQGRALDSTGGLVGASAPVNRTVTFRVWDHASNVLLANLLYSEQQTVTISDGEFSVLIGQGTATAGNALGFSETSKGLPTVKIGDLAVFGGANRFLGVTIDDGTAAVDNEITPRQQIVSSAYAFRAKYAEQLGSNGSTALTALDSGNVGIGNSTPPALFTVTGANTSTTTSTPQLLITADDTNERLRIGVDGTGNGTGFIQAYKEGTGAQSLLLNSSGGNVGIGTTSPGAKLDVVAAGLGFPATSGSIQSAGLFARFRGGSNAILDMGSNSSLGFWLQSTDILNLGLNYPLMLNPNGGNVGIGTNAPGNRLTIQRTIGSNDTTAQQHNLQLQIQNGIGYKSMGIGVMDDGKGVLQVKELNNGAGYADLLLNPISGNVGIGTTVARAKLEVAGAIVTNSNSTLAGRYLGGGEMALVGWSGSPFSGKTIFGTDGTSWRYSIASKNGSAAEVDRLVVMDNGNVGIGTTTPNHTLTVGPNPGDAQSFSIRAYSTNNQNWQGGGAFGGSKATVVMGEIVGVAVIGGHSPTLSTWQNFCINPSGGYVGIGTLTPSSLLQVAGTVTYAAAATSSDLRIKKVQGISDGRVDLDSLIKIKITDYSYIDTKLTSNKPQKKVIAQQVETVYPQAVNQSTDVVPDIYQKATAKDGWVVLATDLKKGDRVKLIGDNEQGVHEVLEVTAGKFRTDFKAEGDVFVYGREVKDFRTVDYDAIAMLNVSATQQLARELKTVQEENAALRRELVAKDETMEARLIALEQRLSKGGTPETVSIKTANAAK